MLKDIPVTMPDFFRGLLVGVGLGLEIIGFVLLKKNGGLVHKPKGRNAGL